MGKTKIIFSLNEKTTELLRSELELLRLGVNEQVREKIDDILSKLGGNVELNAEDLCDEDSVKDPNKCDVEYFAQDFAEDLSLTIEYLLEA